MWKIKDGHQVIAIVHFTQPFAQVSLTCETQVKNYDYWYIRWLSTKFQLYLGSQFYWWRKIEYSPVTSNLSDTDISFSLINLFTNILMHFG